MKKYFKVDGEEEEENIFEEEEEDENEEEEKTEKEECDLDDVDCIVEEELQKFKPNKISLLSFPDEQFEQKVVLKDNPKLIYGSGSNEPFICVCGVVIKKQKTR